MQSIYQALWLRLHVFKVRVLTQQWNHRSQVLDLFLQELHRNTVKPVIDDILDHMVLLHEDVPTSLLQVGCFRDIKLCWQLVFLQNSIQPVRLLFLHTGTGMLVSAHSVKEVKARWRSNRMPLSSWLDRHDLATGCFLLLLTTFVVEEAILWFDAWITNDVFEIHTSASCSFFKARDFKVQVPNGKDIGLFFVDTTEHDLQKIDLGFSDIQLRLDIALLHVLRQVLVHALVNQDIQQRNVLDYVSTHCSNADTTHGEGQHDDAFVIGKHPCFNVDHPQAQHGLRSRNAVLLQIVVLENSSRADIHTVEIGTLFESPHSIISIGQVPHTQGNSCLELQIALPGFIPDELFFKSPFFLLLVIAHPFGSDPKWTLVVFNQVEVRPSRTIVVVDDFFNDSQVCTLTVRWIDIGGETELFSDWLRWVC